VVEEVILKPCRIPTFPEVSIDNTSDGGGSDGGDTPPPPPPPSN